MKNRFDKLNKSITATAEARGAELAEIRDAIAKAEAAKEAAKREKGAAIEAESREAYNEADAAERAAESSIEYYKTILAKKAAVPVFNVSEIKTELARLYAEMTAKAQQEIAEHVNAIFDITMDLRGEYITEQGILRKAAQSAGLPANAFFVSDDKRELKTIMQIDGAMRRGFCKVTNFALENFGTKYNTLTAEQNIRFWAI